jgi:hypothetical protein
MISRDYYLLYSLIKHPEMIQQLIDYIIMLNPDNLPEAD